jgi:hypothetical protein
LILVGAVRFAESGIRPFVGLKPNCPVIHIDDGIPDK